MAKYSVYRENTRNITLSFDGVDLTGATVYFTVKTEADESANDSTALIQKDVTVHLDDTAGLTRIELTPSDTDVAPGKYLYDIKLKKATGEQTTVDYGTFTVKPAITNRG
jgi:hypothetical protein